MLPQAFEHFFVRNYEISIRITRYSHKINLPKFKTVLYKNSIKYQAAKEWNERIDQLNDKCSVHTFKNRIRPKEMLMKHWPI